MEELVISLVIALQALNLTATFKILYDLGALYGAVRAIKDRVKLLEEKQHNAKMV